MGTKIKQYDIYWVKLDPVEGSEMAKTRPCVVISPDEMNGFLNTVIIAPLTSNLKSVFWRVQISTGMVALDHVRSIAKSRLVNHIGRLQISEIHEIKSVLKEIFVD
ncbi:MAG: type II toxin-antitoxin system PemK/MazF family toxin [Tannerella sp.]|jgi:mRNA interferase MazF|nr:type II toxin-antitoxin system PemK/MazF family toxin [Tannerella sp.]